ncbi:MAG: IS66 family transposase [Prosthecobacter sp.]|uniref:IS66 family transposase n=1 Tax=Prosthecobacter sp. TaxID=1965333 RepID=UPI0039042500
MKITPDVFEAYLKCPTKAWLRATGEPSTGYSYAEWAHTRAESYGITATARLVGDSPSEEVATSPDLATMKTAKWRLATCLAARAQIETCVLESDLHAVERVSAAVQGKPAQFIPIRFIFANKLGKNDKLLLAFDAYVLSKSLGRDVNNGKIIHGDNDATMKIKASGLFGEVRKHLERIVVLLSSPVPPDLVLNRHCAECEFQARCRQKAMEKDDLSLLTSMSEKERKKFQSKGIFTVTQFSYTFRPRRRPKRKRDKQEKYHHSLKAMAIREKRIHIVGSPELQIDGTPVYLDVEGLPDRDFYYLIGLRIGNGDSAVHHSLWADTAQAEPKIWKKFLSVLNTVERPVLIHYGSYETIFLKRMSERYGKPSESSVPAKAIQTAVNLLTVTFARVYFPTFSNGLKEIAGYLGFRWTDPHGSGVQSIRLRHEWEESGSPSLKTALLTYNAEDCEAVEVVTSKLFELHRASPHSEGTSLAGVVDTTMLKREHPFGFKCNKFVFPELEVINKAAYWDYQRERVYVRSSARVKHAVRQTSTPKRAVSPDTTIECPRPKYCPQCGSSKLVAYGKVSKTVFDLKFMRHGVKRWIARYQFHRYQCQVCGATFYPDERSWTRSKFGPDLMAYAIYQNIGLRLPQESVASNLNKLFCLQLPLGIASKFKKSAAQAYEETYDALLKRVCAGRLVHADETKISLKSGDGFVWVFANMEEVAYVYSETREGELIADLLKNFTGVLVSDFYAAYDAIQCPQQKCLIHLIRDMNDDVLKHPYDEQLKRVALGFATLVKPMVETVDRHGLKTHFLRKHLVSVDRFYRQISAMDIQSDVAVKLRDRLQKYRDKLFTFLSIDGVPWNNNNAEHAVKAFATLRHFIAGVTTEKGIREYLILLSICETCKYKGVDFLDFLRSGEKDIGAYGA